MNLFQADAKTRIQKNPIIHISIYLHFHFSVMKGINVLSAATEEAAAHGCELCAHFA
jgi:hypothetical protein